MIGGAGPGHVRIRDLVTGVAEATAKDDGMGIGMGMGMGMGMGTGMMEESMGGRAWRHVMYRIIRMSITGQVCNSV